MRKYFLGGLLKLASSRFGQRSSIQSLMMNRLSPALFLDTVNSYQRTAAIKAAIELDLFTAIGEGHETSQALHWSNSGMNYWAVSDLNGVEFLEVARLIPTPQQAPRHKP